MLNNITESTNENICEGCIYDIPYKTQMTEEMFNAMLETCFSCKRCYLEKYQKGYSDLYDNGEWDDK